MTARPVRTPILLAAAAVFLGAAACAEPGPVRWQKPGASADDWARDQSSCRYKARRQVDREFRAQPPDPGSSLLGGSSALERDMAVHDARRRERRLFEDCLKTLGYSPDDAAKRQK